MVFSSGKLSSAIVSIHLLIACAFLFGYSPKPASKPKKIQIHTITAKPQRHTAAQKPASSGKKQSASSKKSVPAAVKKPTPAATPAKKIIKPAHPVKKETTHSPTSLAPLMAELEERIAKIDKNHDKLNESKRLEKPAVMSFLEVEKFSSSEEEENLKSSLGEELIGFLYETLHLPDFGRVKVRLTVSSIGMIKSIAILESESTLNSKYLEAHLPGLHLPLKKEGNEERNFVVNFCNEF